MGFNCGIVGLPNVGKSTIFNALTNAGAQSANYPFCTIEPNVGRVDVPDARLQELDSIIHAQRVVPASMEFVDIAGLVRGASKGEGLGNQFLGHIRATDAIAHVVRCFENADITHVDGSVDPMRDMQTIDLELILSDVATVEQSLQRHQKLLKTNKKEYPLICKMLEALLKHLNSDNLPARAFPLAAFIADTFEVQAAYRDLHLISDKPLLYVCNVDEDLAHGSEDNAFTKIVKEKAAQEKAGVVIICGKLEEELSQMPADAKKEMIEGLGMSEPGLNRLIRIGYETLGRITYFTAGEKEIHAWTILKGDKAPAAAGKIHSDFERGYICAEVYRIPDLLTCKSKAKLKEAGLLRTEGKDYTVSDGDVMEFRFNV